MQSREAVLKARYLRDGETEDQFYWRVARAWGTDEEHAAKLHTLMHDQRGFLNTPALANAGLSEAMGSACFVLPILDSLESIMRTLSDAALVQKAGGGTGFDFSKLRAKGMLVGGTGRGAPGPVSFLEMYNEVIGRVTQAGMRPGANMGILRVDHPDILDFVACKHQEGSITNFNISVALTDEFMFRVHNGLLNEYEERVWDAIIDGVWRNGEPGVFFVDTVNQRAPHRELIDATNPCGEVPLRPYEACVLGSLNLAKYVTPSGRFTFNKFHDDIRVMVEALDNVIDRQHYPLPEIEVQQKRYRKIGLGVMGYADMLCEMGFRYGSSQALDFTDKVASALANASKGVSSELASTRGTYEAYAHTLPERRNICVNAIAPTGSIARLAGCSWSIEPHFDVDENGNHMSFVVGGAFVDHIKYHNHPCFTPASQVTLDQHIATQEVWQRYVDQAVSKTINCPNATTRAAMERAIVQGWHDGLKGMTFLREGSRDDVVIGATGGDCVGVACSITEDTLPD